MDAPERIWAFRTVEFISGIECGSWTAIEVAKGSEEFIRADLCADPALLAEAVEVLRTLCNEWGRTEPGTLSRAHNDARAFLAKMENRHGR